MASEESPLEKAKRLLEEFGLAKAEEAIAVLGEVQADPDAAKLLVEIHLARKNFDTALKLAEQAASAPSEAARRARGQMLVAQVRLARGDGQAEAIDSLGKAQALFRDAGDKAGEVEAMGLVSQLHLEAGDPDAALRVAREAVAASSEAMTAMHIIAQVQLARGSVAAAVEQATEMLAVCKDRGNKAGQASASLVLANAILSQEQTSTDGLQFGREALALFQEVRDIYGTQSALHTLANGYFACGDLEEGLKCAREALACFRQTGDAVSADMLRETIEQARTTTQEWRKQYPKRPFVLPPSATTPPPLAGPERCMAAECAVPPEVLDYATAGRKYWGVPTQVQPDPTIDAAARAPSHSVVWGMCLSDNTPTQVCVEFGDLLVCMAKGDIAKTPIVVLTCGVYGRQTGEMQVGSMTNVSAATIWGMVRTARQEMPSVLVQLLDFSEALTAAEIPRTLRPPLPESAYYSKARWEPQIAAVPSLFRRELRRDNLTGGGGGSAEDQTKKAKFLRKTFSWTGPSHKLDFCWYRQEWRACGPMFGDIGPMPPPPPCRAMRSC